MITKGKTTKMQKDPAKGPPRRSNPQQLLTDYMFTNVVEDPNRFDKRKIIFYSLEFRRLFPDEQKGHHKGTKETLFRSLYPHSGRM